ncbi:hypothetical protein JM81_2552 [Maribacter sp. MAR_2009_72]|nr:hypothetical protein JM81_2552 [Maribacter sp. MAR_2009_72]
MGLSINQKADAQLPSYSNKKNLKKCSNDKKSFFANSSIISAKWM